MQLALSYPSEIRAVIAAYPVLDVKSKFYTEAYPKPILGVPNFPNEIIEEHISAMRAAPSPTVITAANPPRSSQAGILSISKWSIARVPRVGRQSLPDEQG
jgi:hypothetical protein